MSHVLLRQHHRQKLPPSCKNLNPPNDDLDGNVEVATHDAIDGLQIHSGQFSSRTFFETPGNGLERNACRVATAPRFFSKNLRIRKKIIMAE